MDWITKIWKEDEKGTKILDVLRTISKNQMEKD